MFVEILRELPPDQIVTKKGAEAWTVAHEHIAYGISGAKITIISMSQRGPGSYFTQQQFDHLARFGNRLATTARFALERLAGTRRVTANAVPPRFRFAQEAAEATGRDTSLATEWAVWCERARRLDHDVLRTGMKTSMVEGGHATGTRQVAIYPDVPTARAAAEELRAALTGCDGLTPDRSMNSDDVHVLTTEPGDSTTVAAAVAQWGTAVFVTVENGHTDGPTKADALSYTREAVRANRPLVCEVVPRCA
jgi:hypothetical protein